MPGGYRVETRPRVRKDLRKLDQAVRSGVLQIFNGGGYEGVGRQASEAID